MIYTSLRHLLCEWKQSFVSISCPSCCSWVCDFPAAEYPAAGWTEFTPFAYQPRKTLSRRVWEEAIEGPTVQVVDFWFGILWSSMWSGYTPIWFLSTFCCVYNGCLNYKARNSKLLKLARITALKWRTDSDDRDWPWEKMRGRTSHQMMLVGEVGDVGV